MRLFASLLQRCAGQESVCFFGEEYDQIRMQLTLISADDCFSMPRLDFYELSLLLTHGGKRKMRCGLIIQNCKLSFPLRSHSCSPKEKFFTRAL